MSLMDFWVIEYWSISGGANSKKTKTHCDSNLNAIVFI